MVSTPHILTLTVYDTDGTTLRSGAKVYVRNCTKKSSSDEATTNGSGVAAIDLANLDLVAPNTVPYETGDVTLIIATYGNTHIASRYVVAGSSKAQTLYLTPMAHVKGTVMEKIIALTAANTSASTAYYTKLYAVDDGQLILQLQNAANETQMFHADGGLSASGGAVVETENKAIVVTSVRR